MPYGRLLARGFVGRGNKDLNIFVGTWTDYKIHLPNSANYR